MITVRDVARPDRIVRVRTEIAALTRSFDYAVPPGWSGRQVTVGTRVRVPLHGRSVRGWVVEEDVEASAGVDVVPLKSWLGLGPPPSLVRLAEWAAWRWAGPVPFFLNAASPAVVVRDVPAGPPASPRPTQGTPRGTTGEPAPGDVTAADVWERADHAALTVVRLSPATDLIDLVLAVLDDPDLASRPGSVLVLVPSTGWAERLTARLRRRGYAATTSWDEARAGWPVVVGARAGAWSPLPALSAAVVLDAHDPAYREESAPTYSAVDVVVERARRDGAACLLVSPVPPVTLPPAPVVSAAASDERNGWALLERVDRRAADPRTGIFSDEFVRLARTVLEQADSRVTRTTAATPDPPDGPVPLVCVYNRKGGASLLACAACGELARCARCGAAAKRGHDGNSLQCPRCGEARPVVCAACGRLRMRTLRPGVSRLREELEALLSVPVGEVSGPRRRGHGRREPVGAESAPVVAPVLVGTEAVLHRVRQAAAVVFLDIDLHLMSPRLSATEETLSLLVRASRLVGARGTGPSWARVQVQTRVPDHPVLSAAGRGDPASVLAVELEVRRQSSLPPFAAMALVSGTLAPAYADALRTSLSVDGALTLSTLGPESFLVQAPNQDTLCDLLARTPRPAGRGLRVEVDPATL
jgi:primosomal protein N' (replication factor Y) (superfamily II helicase)